MEKLKFYIILVLFVVCIGFGIYASITTTQLRKTQTELEYAVNNAKAYEYENSKISKENRQFLLTIDQLNSSKDSLVQKLNAARKDLRIKDKNIKELQYIASQASKTDSIFVRDTIFVEEVKLDTILTDQWASMRLQLEYPNKIITDYSFKNEEIIIASAKKETVNPPKKCWLARLFQKKHTVITVEVVQQNPYCETKEQRHIKLIE